MNSSSNEMKKFDISNPSTFEVFDKEMISHIGLHCDGVMISAVRDERLDYSLSTCVFEPEYTIVGRGRQYKGVVMPEGLNYNAFRIKFPLEKLNNNKNTIRTIRNGITPIFCILTFKFCQPVSNLIIL